MECPWFRHPYFDEAARCVTHWGFLPLVGRENLIEEFRRRQPLSVRLRARSDQSSASSGSQGSLALGLLPFPTILRYPRLHRLHADVCLFGDGNNVVSKFVGLHLGHGQDRHGVVDQAIDWSFGYRGFCRPRIVPEMIERSAMRKAMNEEVAVVATHNFGFATSVVCAFQRIGQSFADEAIWIRK